MLLPPDLTEWVPDDHVVWSILGAVDQMDLGAFYGVYRENGQGRAAYEPSMMVALLLYAYARGNRSSRGIERECREDVVYKLITAMRVPDHSTIAEFRRRHEAALGALFTEVLALCDEAGLVEVGVISIDGTKIRANASRGANRTYEKLVADILREAEETDRWEDGLFGEIVVMRCRSICGPRRGAERRSRPRGNGWRRRPAVARSPRWRGSSLIRSSLSARGGVGVRGIGRVTRSCWPARAGAEPIAPRGPRGCLRRLTGWRRTSLVEIQASEAYEVGRRSGARVACPARSSGCHRGPTPHRWCPTE